MKSYTLVFVALATVLFYIEYASAMEVCRAENCVVPDKCQLLMKRDYVCHQQGTSCCNVVKSEFITHCHQHGGGCMDKCSSTLQRNAVDCPADQVCCVLV